MSLSATSQKSTNAFDQRRLPPLTIGGHFYFGDLFRFWGDPLNFVMDVFHQYGEIARLRFGPVESYFVANPDMIKHVLQENNKNYVREPNFNRLILQTGISLFSSDGDYWLQQRRIMQPAFHRQRIAGLGEIMTGEAEKTLARWQKMDGRPIEVEHEMMDLTMNVVGRALFSVDMAAEAANLHTAFTTTSSYITFRLRRPFYPPLWFPTPANRRFQKANRTVRGVIGNMVGQRRQMNGDAPNDLLTMLIESRYEDTGEGMTDEQIINESASMVFAGHETTANTLTWTFYLLSQHPAVEARLHEELERVLGGRTPTMADLPNLPYNRMVIEETMRLYPPAWSTSRQSVAADHLGDYDLPANAAVFLAFYVMHRHPGYWQKPEEFDPERFTPERAAGRPRFAYVPFGGGPRQCIGNVFAMTEAQLVLATIAGRLRLRLVPGYVVAPAPIFTLRTRNGLLMTAEAR